MFDLQCSNPALIPEAWPEYIDTDFAGERTRLASMKKKDEDNDTLSGSPDFLRFFHECIARHESRTTLPSLHRKYYSDCAEGKLLIRVAEQIKAPETLKALSTHENYEVRQAVAENESTPPETLFVLASDANADVRYRLAETHTTPIDILGHLLADENPYVAARAQATIKRLSFPSTASFRPRLSVTTSQPLRSNNRRANAPGNAAPLLSVVNR